MSDASSRRLLAAAVVASTAWGVGAFETAPSREITNVAAFARSMASSVTSIRATPLPRSIGSAPPSMACGACGLPRTTRASRLALKELFGPLGPGIDIGARLPTRTAAGSTDPALIAWRYLGPGFAGANRPGPVRREADASYTVAESDH